MGDAIDQGIGQAIQAGRFHRVSAECVVTDRGARLGCVGSPFSDHTREQLARLLDSYEADIAVAAQMRDRMQAMLDAIDAEAAKAVGEKDSR